MTRLALDAAALERAAIHIARPLGLDPATTPILDARLDDGSRVAICVPPASPAVAITVRRFGTRAFSAAQLVEQHALPANVRDAAERVLHTRRNILVSGGTGSGKTTLLNALMALIPDDERIVAIEDTLELRIDSPNCVRFEARGLQHGAVTIRDLVKHALRHRPDHIVVGEVRGGEAADLLQALNTGHGGSLTTVHANNAESALSRLASCAMQGGGELPWEVTCRGRGRRHRDGDPHDARRRAALRRRSGVRQRLRRRDQSMGHTTTRPHDRLRTCRARWLIAGRAHRAAGRQAGGERTRPRGSTHHTPGAPPMTDLTTTRAEQLRTRATKRLDAMRAAITRADAARSDAAHQARATHVADVAQTAAVAHRVAAEAWDALATHAATQARDCRRGAELAERTRHRWATSR